LRFFLFNEINVSRAKLNDRPDLRDLDRSRRQGPLVSSPRARRSAGSGRKLDWFFGQWFERTGAPDFKLSWSQAGDNRAGSSTRLNRTIEHGSRSISGAVQAVIWSASSRSRGQALLSNNPLAFALTRSSSIPTSRCCAGLPSITPPPTVFAVSPNRSKAGTSQVAAVPGRAEARARAGPRGFRRERSVRGRGMGRAPGAGRAVGRRGADGTAARGEPVAGAGIPVFAWPVLPGDRAQLLVGERWCTMRGLNRRRAGRIFS
jgi:hypothetical protein